MSENPPAFPHLEPRDPQFSSAQPGMTLRDWFAGQVLSGAAVPSYWCGNLNEGLNDTPKAVAERAYLIADAMLAERSALPTNLAQEPLV